jgi:hypothetical protein
MLKEGKVTKECIALVTTRKKQKIRVSVENSLL